MTFRIRISAACVAALALGACNSATTSPEPVAKPQVSAKKTARENRKANNEIWASRSPIKINGVTYSVAVAPEKAYALVGWDSSAKTINLVDLEAAASRISGCKAKDESILSFLSGPQNTPIKTEILNKNKFLRVSLSC
ncbi:MULTISPECIES: hypothetical protein [Mameliella]|uniref:Uncharacterized protein n=1 Tax=Mameliella alba TaxID=561184 RepID=A0A0B3S5L7_9RHOB|nr:MULTISPECIES: hypothetical protein [Mameliella]KHQ54293.1 hypothetical protein OA50_00885 [Mameliella alba]MBY6118593.1 hypothetical protein [Mameliella alba]MDD9732930.1 hypothetical protein [Mameliella sp. AT18]PTR35820.1 hypothetical protein LX94_04462 [Mameliella alba]SDE09815.1 hypothetical protein SAMN05216376_11799 [Mameliella alba]